MKRRQFIRTATAGLAVPAVVPASVLGRDGRPAPGDRIVMGVIGLGGMGTGNMRGFLNHDDVQVVAVCDVDRAHSRSRSGEGDQYGREPARATVESHYAEATRGGTFKGCAAYADFRELCAREDIDAVVVATPDHWHALCTLEALRHGKDVYCEKPVTHLFAEGVAVYREVAERGAIFQTGSQQRSDLKFQIAVEIVRNGLIGDVGRVEVGLPTGPDQARGGGGGGAPPEGLDYDFWCGPSPVLPYHPARHHGNWRWHLSYGGGQIMDWIGHHNDIAHWALGMDKSGPQRVEASGFTFPETDLYNAPVDYEVRCEYADGVSVSISNKHAMGVKWTGSDGWVYVSRGKLEASEPSWVRQSFDRGPFKAYPSRSHHRNFLDGIRSREECVAPAETAHRSATPGHLGYVSHTLGRALRWNPQNEAVLDDDEADRLLKAVDYRGEWSLVG